MSLRRRLALLAWLLAIGWLGYGGIDGHQLLHWDDIAYLTAHPQAQAVNTGNLRWMLLGAAMENWHPLTWLSYALNHEIDGASVRGLKYTNLALHGLAALVIGLLTFRIFERAHGPRAPGARNRPAVLAATIAATLFCIHPQHVESVTWISERKDLLCGLFYFLALYFHAGSATPLASLPVFVCGVLAMMSKSMAVTLPVALVMLDLYPLGRIRRTTWPGDLLRCIAGKWMLLLASLAVIAITLATQSPQPLEHAPFSTRLLVAVQATGFYIRQFLVPLEFIPFHPFAAYSEPDTVLLAFALVPALALALVFAVCGTGSAATAGLAMFGFYLATLAPVLGLVKVGEQAFADRYAYIPLAPAYIASGWLAAWALMRLGSRALRGVCSALLASVGVVFILLTRTATDTWRDDETLWTTVITRYTGVSATPHNNLGNVLYERGDYAGAIRQYRIAFELAPWNLGTHFNLAISHARSGHHRETNVMIERMLRDFADHPRAWSWSGELVLGYRDLPRAEQLFLKALQLDPTLEHALSGLARTYFLAGDPERGRAYLSRLGPDSPHREAVRALDPGE